MSTTLTAQPTVSKNRTEQKTPQTDRWSFTGKLLFRTFTVFVLFLCIPTNANYYTRLIGYDWSNINWVFMGGILSGLGAPEFIDLPFEDIWELYSYINVLITFGISIVIGLLWTVLDRKTENYNRLYYWVLLIARYRAGFGIIAWGFKKLIPLQMELPSISFLLTKFGDFSEQKIYWTQVGIAQKYEIFLGIAEVLAGTFLLFRKTAALGGFLLAVLLFNIVLANHAYDGMVHVASFVYTILGGFVLWYYWRDIYTLIVLEKDVKPVRYYPSFSIPWQKWSRIILKSAAILLAVFFQFYLEYKDRHIGYRYPHNFPGLSNAAGIYNISEFRLNGKLIPYSPVDSTRWQDAVLEEWTTLSVNVNKLQQMDLENTGREGNKAIDKRYEYRGVAGRVFYNYTIDSVKKVLHFQNKNLEYRDQKMSLHYERPHSERIILNGMNEFNDSVYIVMDRVKRDFPLFDIRRDGSANSGSPATIHTVQR